MERDVPSDNGTGMGQMNEDKFSKYERARILGARGLQISMDAPLLLKMDDETLTGINFDPLKMAEIELDSGVLPITIKRPLPRRREEGIEKLKLEDIQSDEEKIAKEESDVKEISEEGEIMELVNLEDEAEEVSSGSESSEE